MTCKKILSPQQSIIMQYLADGCTIKEIALKMELAKETIRKHVNKAKCKLGAKTHDQAIALAVARCEVTVQLGELE